MTRVRADARPLTLALTCGEPAGVGPEVAARALQRPPADCELVLVGPPAVWDRAAAAVGGRPLSARHRVVAAGAEVPVDWDWGAPTPGSGRVAAQAVGEAVRLALAGAVDGLVTAPLTKAGLHAAGLAFPGHTELLAHLCGPGHFHPTMLLAGERLRVFLVTTHLALRDVPAAITGERVLATVRAAHRALEDDLGVPAPRLAVCALNPHGGEGGVFGDEDQRVIAPAVTAARAEGLTVHGPLPADSLFHRAVDGQFDAVVAMYHDQGLIPLKLLHFDDGVNVTLGLPIVRTSPDHGTAFDIAGRGLASAASMAEALRWAAQIALRRRARGAAEG